MEHCSIIWRPVTETEISAFEKLQKKAIKWILNELYQHYDNETYSLRCSQIRIVPMLVFFDINDLVFFHKIVNNKIPFSLPDYIKPCLGKGRLRQSNLDPLSYISTFVSDSTNVSSRSPFYKSFFHKVLHAWNSLPFSIRNMAESTSFKHKVLHAWNSLPFSIRNMAESTSFKHKMLHAWNSLPFSIRNMAESTSFNTKYG